MIGTHRTEPDDDALTAAPPLDPRIPTWSAAQLRARRCPSCDADRPQLIVRRPDRLVVARCPACLMIYLPMVPSDELLAEFYERYSTAHQVWQSGKTAAGAIASARRRRHGNGLLLEIAQRRRVRGARLLEVGCSKGSFLLDAREAGAEVSGVEIDGPARAFVETLDIRCHQSLDHAHMSAPFDIIVALNVIEHLPNPRSWTESLASLLAPGGMAVLWTPNGGQVATFGAGWVGFRVDLDHLNYFSAATLSRLVLGCGLWPEACWEFSQANLAGFTNAAPERAWSSRLRRWWRAPVPTWALPAAGGGYTLALFAGKPPAPRIN